MFVVDVSRSVRMKTGAEAKRSRLCKNTGKIKLAQQTECWFQLTQSCDCIAIGVINRSVALHAQFHFI